MSPTASPGVVSRAVATLRALFTPRIQQSDAGSHGGWFLDYKPIDPALPGAPWGFDTAYAKRAVTADPAGTHPWDDGNEVSPFVGGFEAMSAIRDALEQCLAEARKAPRAQTDRGLVYLAGWRINSLRDLSASNAWGTGPWIDPGTQKPYAHADKTDQTVLGMLVKLIDAGVRVRVMVWQPTWIQKQGGLEQHRDDHLYLARVIRRTNQLTQIAYQTPNTDYGVMCLDSRVAEGAHAIAAAHHQKMCVVRTAGGGDAWAFVGGVDLAYTRRDAPADMSPAVPQYNDGDWQSGKNTAGDATHPPTGIPSVLDSWPLGDLSPVADGLWAAVRQVPQAAGSDARFGGDLNIAAYGADHQHWHDQHLRIRGPAVATFEQQFCERWQDAGVLEVLADGQTAWPRGEGKALFSSEAAVILPAFNPGGFGPNLNAYSVVALPSPRSVPPVPGGVSSVQMWRTIPVRPRGSATLFRHGEFTVLAGYSNAISNAKKLIFICDQYFWSIPLGRSLRAAVQKNPDLGVVVILPPHGDDAKESRCDCMHQARRNAFAALRDGLSPDELKRVHVFNAWYWPTNVGVYVHAKAHVYDGSLLVCGSANINRRSMVGDSELAAAVFDPSVATAHLKQLWALFTAGSPWPKVAAASGSPATRPFDPTQDAGISFVQGMIDYVANHPETQSPVGNLISDPQFDDPTGGPFTLPNNARRGNTTFYENFGQMYNFLLESSSLKPSAIEGGTAADDLASMSNKVENLKTFAAVGRGAVATSPVKPPSSGKTP